MSTVIQVQNLSKRYRIGLKEKRHDTFAQQILATIKAPIQNFRQLRSMSKFGADDESIFWALKDINFEVQQGEVLGIIGHNGAGKSTLLKILSKITEPTAGEVRIKGRIAALLEVGTGFHQDLTGRENIYMNGTILGMSKKEIDRKLDEIIDFSGVEKYVDTPVKFYSSGMKVRLGFSVAAHLDPEILIIDEVLAVGDAEFQRKCLGKMEQVATQGRTVLFVSHNMLAVKSLCSTVLLIHNGEVKKTGNTESVINSYLADASRTFSFLSCAEINKELDEFTIHTVSVSNNGKEGNFNIEEDLIFKIRVSSTKNYRTINVNIFFNTIENITVFVTHSTAEYFTAGQYYFECKIPGCTLNSISYNIDVMVVQDGTVILHHLKNVLYFQGQENKRIGWAGDFPGLIRPQYFDWNKSKI